VRITALGHAGLKVETSNATLLVDPWFSPEGAFQGSWFQYPDNSHLLQEPSLYEPTAVVISHEHLDHVDPWFLSQVRSSVPIIIPRYPTPALRRKIASAGPRTVIEAKPWDSVQVASGTSLFFVSEQSPMNHDSAIVISADGSSLLNLNDARLFAVQLRSIRQHLGGEIDALTFQGAGASWYPMIYHYPKDKEARLSANKRDVKLRFAAKCIDLLEPVVAIPFAGPPAFLDPALFHHNRQMEGGIFPDQDQVADWLARRKNRNLVVLLPGDCWDAKARVKVSDQVWSEFSFADRWSYLEAYAERRRRYLGEVLRRFPEPHESLWEPFRDYFERLLTLSPYFNKRIDMRVGFDITGAGGGDWAVDFRPGKEGVDREAGGCPYRYRFESRWLAALVSESIPWEDFFLSLRFTATRRPDLYNDHLLGLLKFAEPDALNEVETFEHSLESDERITIHHDGSVYSVSRRCPHAGNDLLETGEVMPGGILRCLAHHYEFELATGRCRNGITSSLDVTVLRAHSSVSEPETVETTWPPPGPPAN
jgi:UDP-MurNAc hydroxylase